MGRQPSVNPTADASTNPKMSGATNSTVESSCGLPADAKGEAKPNPTTTNADQGLMPRSTLPPSKAAEIAGELAKEVRTVIDEAVKWAGKKADELSKEEEDGVGPYASPATCVPSELDPLASGVLPALEAEKSLQRKASDARKDGELQGKTAGGERKE